MFYKEGVTEGEYSRAVANLNDFLAVDIEKLDSYELLANEASSVGRSLRLLTIAESAPGVFSNSFDSVFTGADLTNNARCLFRNTSLNKDIAVVSDDNKVIIRVWDKPKELGFRGFSRTDFDGNVVYLPSVLGLTSVAWARAIVGANKEVYSPGLLQGSPQTNQGFARVLQQDLRQLISAL